MDLISLHAGVVEVEGEEADRYMEDLARNFVFVDLRMISISIFNEPSEREETYE